MLSVSLDRMRWWFASTAKIPNNAIEDLVDLRLGIVFEHRDVALDLGSIGNAFHGSPRINLGENSLTILDAGEGVTLRNYLFGCL